MSGRPLRGSLGVFSLPKVHIKINELYLQQTCLSYSLFETHLRNRRTPQKTFQSSCFCRTKGLFLHRFSCEVFNAYQSFGDLLFLKDFRQDISYNLPCTKCLEKCFLYRRRTLMPPERYIMSQRILDVSMKPREKPYLKTMILMPFFIRNILQRSSNENVTIKPRNFEMIFSISFKVILSNMRYIKSNNNNKEKITQQRLATSHCGIIELKKRNAKQKSPLLLSFI